MTKRIITSLAAVLAAGAVGLAINAAAAGTFGRAHGARGPAVGFVHHIAQPEAHNLVAHEHFAHQHLAGRRDLHHPAGPNVANHPAGPDVAHRPVGPNEAGEHGPATPVHNGAEPNQNGSGEPVAREFHHGFFDSRHFQRGYVGWAGPVFWPHAYDDLFDYALWPYDESAGYYDSFWAYGYDDVFGGIFLPYAASAGYAAGENVGPGGYEPAFRTPSSSVTHLCGAAQANFVQEPINRLAKVIQPSSSQRVKLNALAAAETTAANVLQASCVMEPPTTVIGRLNAVEARIHAMLEAVDIVRPALDDFDASLTDEQKARFNQLGAGANPRQQESAAQASLTQLCGAQQAVPAFPISEIDRVVGPDRQQRAKLARLRDAAHQADNDITAACPAQTSLTPPDRLAAIGNRLQAMFVGIETVRWPLQQFYASLNNEQKGLFNAIGGQRVAFQAQP